MTHLLRDISRTSDGYKGMATPIAGAIVLFGFNNAVTSIVTIATVTIVSIVLAYIIGTLINKFNLMNINFKMPSKKNHIRVFNYGKEL